MMRPWVAGILSFSATLLIGAAVVVLWLTGGTAYTVTLRVPGTDRPAGATGQDVPQKIEGKLTTFDAPLQPEEIRASWPGFRGPRRENISDDLTDLAESWPTGGPPVLWRLAVGEGHAGPAILGGRMYLHDYDPNQRAEIIRCLSLTTAKDIWRYTYRLPVKRNHGVSRTVPAVTDKYLVAMGAKCHVTCLDSQTGSHRWTIDLVNEYGTKIPPWYAGQCPLIDDGNAILAPGATVREEVDSRGNVVQLGRSVLMMAVSCETGKVIWQTPNPDDWQMTHSSIAVVELEDYTKIYVYCGSGGVVGVAANTGQVLWKNTDWKIKMANVPTPVSLDGGKVFLTGGYGAGCAMLQIVKEGDKYAAKVVFRLPPSQFGSQQQTPVHYKNHLFGTRVDERFVCLSDQGQVVWASPPDARFGKEGGAYAIADDMIFALDDEGVLTMMKATPQSYQPLARAKVLPGHYSWGPMAIVAGRLICRDLNHMVCLDVARKKD